MIANPNSFARVDRLVSLSHTAGLRRVTSEQGKEVVGRRDREDYAGILFPYVWPGTTLACAHRIRRDNPPYTIRAGARVEDGKYLSAPGYGNKLTRIGNQPAPSSRLQKRRWGSLGSEDSPRALAG